MKTKLTVEFDTREFEMAHGKRPRGFGSWAFKVQGQEDLFWAHQCTYGDAKSRLVAELPHLTPEQYVLVTVCS